MAPWRTRSRTPLSGPRQICIFSCSAPSRIRGGTCRWAIYWPPFAERNVVTATTIRLHRWDEIALEKVTEMISRKIVTGQREMLAQIYLKKGALVPMHSHESEQMTYVLQGAMKFLIDGEEITVREGEVLHIPSWVEHQAEALDDTFELDLFSPIRQDWLDHTDTYFHKTVER
jgi:quercetin dioxygenase-like cupin family protein